MLKHLAQFNLKYPEGDPMNDEVIAIMREWGPQLPEAKEVRVYKNVDPSNPFKYCIEVDFGEADYSALERYMDNPVHDKFCDDVWFKHVKNQLNLNLIEEC